MNAGRLLFLPLLFFYGVLFFMQERHFAEMPQQLAHPLPPTIQRAALGYLRQLGGEMHFIKTAVFYGGVKPGRDPQEYAEPLAQHFSTAVSLHPHFIDSYFLCQAILPYISKEYARHTNTLLASGIAVMPDDFILPFFAGFNSFYFLGEPLEAARLFRLAAQRPNAPPMLGHLATILSAEGGDIYAALISLQGLYATEKNEAAKKRYAEELAVFQKAATVLAAIRQYEKEHGATIENLENLVPRYLPAIPNVGPFFFLEWQPPHLRVIRITQRTKFLDSTMKW